MFLGGEKFNDIKSLCFTEYANFLMVKKNIEKAAKFYDMAICLKPNNPYAYAGLAGVQVEERLFKEALESCNKALSIKPGGRRFVLQSIIYKLLGDNVFAEKAIQDALKYFRNNLGDVYNRLAYTYYEFRMYEEAEYYCKELIKMYPDSGSTHSNLAKIYLSQEKFQEAKDEFQKGLELTSDKRYKKYATENIKSINQGNKRIKGGAVGSGLLTFRGCAEHRKHKRKT